MVTSHKLLTCFHPPGKPCVNFTILNSDRVNVPGVFEDVLSVACETGYYIPIQTDPFPVACQANQTWNITNSSGISRITECIRTYFMDLPISTVLKLVVNEHIVYFTLLYETFFVF